MESSDPNPESDIHFQHRISQIFIVFTVSCLGIAIPYTLRKLGYIDQIHSSPLFFILKSFSAGIILGVALCHLLPESIEVLAEHFEYPLALALVGAGILLTLGIDQVTLHFMKSISNKEAKDIEGVNPISDPSIHAHSHAINLVPDWNRGKAITKLCILEASIAIHSVVIGYSFGASVDLSLDELKILMIALAFHQFFEGISLGSAMIESNLSFTTMILFSLSFALSWSLGAVVGIVQEPHEEASIVQGCFTAVATGLLLYAALIEMIGEDYSSTELVNKPGLKMAMYGSLLVGTACMEVLAIWA